MSANSTYYFHISALWWRKINNVGKAPQTNNWKIVSGIEKVFFTDDTKLRVLVYIRGSCHSCILWLLTNGCQLSWLFGVQVWVTETQEELTICLQTIEDSRNHPLIRKPNFALWNMQTTPYMIAWKKCLVTRKESGDDMRIDKSPYLEKNKIKSRTWQC